MPSPNHRKIMTSLAGIVSNRLCTIPLKHLSANMRRNIKTGSTQTTQILRDLLAKRDQAHQRVLQIRSTRSAVQAYKDACRILQKYTRARKSEWWEMKAEEPQRAADRNDMKGFYSGLKEVWGPQTKQPVHLKSSDGCRESSQIARV